LRGSGVRENETYIVYNPNADTVYVDINSGTNG
jgi:hypothetical protein